MDAISAIVEPLCAAAIRRFDARYRRADIFACGSETYPENA